MLSLIIGSAHPEEEHLPILNEGPYAGDLSKINRTPLFPYNADFKHSRFERIILVFRFIIRNGTCNLPRHDASRSFESLLLTSGKKEGINGLQMQTMRQGKG